MMTKHEYPSLAETIYEGGLPNGLAVYVIPKPGYNKKYAFFITDYGGADRRFRVRGEWIDTPAGVAHFLEHKMFDTEDGNALEQLSASGASPNAYTSAGCTAYHFDSTDMFYENLRLLLSFVSVPWFTGESVAKEQGIIGQEIRMIEDSADYVVYYGLMKCLYSHHPVRDSVAGTVESIARITPETLYACHNIFYNPSNMALCVVGDVDPELVMDAARELLPDDKGELPERDYGEPEDDLPAGKRFETAMEVSMPIFSIGAKVTPEKGKEKLRQKLTAALALDYLLGESSPFYTRLYAQGLINDQFYADFDYAAGTSVLMAGGESAAPDKVMGELEKEVAGLAAGLDTALFNRLKKAAFGRLVRMLGSFEGMCRTLADGRFAGYDPMDSFELMEALEPEDIRSFLQENLASERLAISIVKPKG